MSQKPLLWSFIGQNHRRYLLTSFALQGLASALLYAVCGLLFLSPHITPSLIVFISGQVAMMYLYVFGQTVAVVAIQDTIISAAETNAATLAEPPEAD